MMLFVATLLVSCASCVPGVCGCAFSVFPDTWEQAITGPAMIGDLVGLAGVVITGIILLVLRIRR